MKAKIVRIVSCHGFHGNISICFCFSFSRVIINKMHLKYITTHTLVCEAFHSSSFFLQLLCTSFWFFGENIKTYGCWKHSSLALHHITVPMATESYAMLLVVLPVFFSFNILDFVLNCHLMHSFNVHFFRIVSRFVIFSRLLIVNSHHF